MKIEIDPAALEWKSDGTRTIPLQLRDLNSSASALFMSSPPRELFHYTSLDGARGIIESKSLRLTKFTYLNDTSEFRHAIALFRAEVHTAIQSLNHDHREFLRKVATQLDSFESTNVCIASFCEDGDLLSQWRGYGGSGNGLALAFATEPLEQIAKSGWAQLFKCVYDPSHQRRIIQALVKMLIEAHEIALFDTASDRHELLREGVIQGFNTTFLRVAPVLKDQHFAAEREWRLVTLPQKTTDPNYRGLISTARTTTYYLYQFKQSDAGRFNFLRGIVLGPTRDHHLVAEALWQFCRNHALDIQSVSYSSIPFRG